MGQLTANMLVKLKCVLLFLPLMKGEVRWGLNMKDNPPLIREGNRCNIEIRQYLI